LSNTAYTLSVYAKAAEFEHMFFYEIGAVGGTHGVWFNLSTGNVGTTEAAWSNAKMTDMGDGWYRCEATLTYQGSADYWYILAADGDDVRTATASGTNGLYLYGAQAEEASYATSYIPTYGSSVTRVTEPNAMDKTDLVADGFFSSTELTWFIDVDLYERDGGTTVAPRLINSSNSQIFIGFNESLGNKLNIRHKDGSTANNTSGVDFDENGQRFKVLIKISGTTGKAFINGSSVGTFTTLAASNYDVFDNTQNNPYNLNQMLLFPTALTDQEAIDLTTI